MKKVNKKTCAVFTVIVSLIIIISSLSLSFFLHTTSLTFADTVVITDNWADGGAKGVEISRDTDKECFDRITKICNKKGISNSFEIPACMFERYEIEFKSANKSITVIPSDDDCDTMLMQVGNKQVYYYIEKAEKQELDAIIESALKY